MNMLYYIFSLKKKERKLYELRIEKQRDETSSLKNENIQAQQKIRMLQFEIEQSKYKNWISFRAIDYNTAILTKVTNRELEILVYRILSFGRPEKIGCLDASVSTNIFIHDITNCENEGYGSILMEHLIEYAQQNNVFTIVGRLVDCDLETHQERLYHFYQKFGFEIYDIPNSAEKRIKRIINKSK